MPNYTDRLGLVKPLSGEIQDDGRAQYNANFDQLDRMPGTFICTSSTRPGSPFLGQHIYETDSNKTLAWNGTEWLDVTEPKSALRVLLASTVNGEVSVGTGGYAPRFIELGKDLWRFTGRALWNGTLDPAPSTLRWLYIPPAATPEHFVMANGATVQGHSVPFSLRPDDGTTRARAVELWADTPKSRVSNYIYFDTVYSTKSSTP